MGIRFRSSLPRPSAGDANLRCADRGRERSDRATTLCFFCAALAFKMRILPLRRSLGATERNCSQRRTPVPFFAGDRARVRFTDGGDRSESTLTTLSFSVNAIPRPGTVAFFSTPFLSEMAGYTGARMCVADGDTGLIFLQSDSGDDRRSCFR